MIHEFKKIVQRTIKNQENNIESVLVTVVDLDGSSYRRPGVRMLIAETGELFGAISGGCVEKEIVKSSQTVFNNSIPKIITYDGRYRLGCEGVIYILIEPFDIPSEFITFFMENQLKRKSFEIISYYKKGDDITGNFGSIIHFYNGKILPFSKNFQLRKTQDLIKFHQTLNPHPRLVIIGEDHDAEKLCDIAFLLGWEVIVITSMKSQKNITDFPGAISVEAHTCETAKFDDLDHYTAIVIMNHNYAQDLKYLIALRNYKLRYIGILGATKRRDKLFNDLLEFVPNLLEEYIDSIYAPAGLNIGSETPEEIAVSIMAEILSVFRKVEPYNLKKVKGKIHV